MKTLNAPVGLDPDQEADLFELGDIDTTDSALVLMAAEELKNFLYQGADTIYAWCTEENNGILTPIKINNKEYFRMSEVMRVLEQLHARLMKKS